MTDVAVDVPRLLFTAVDANGERLADHVFRFILVVRRTDIEHEFEGTAISLHGPLARSDSLLAKQARRPQALKVVWPMNDPSQIAGAKLVRSLCYRNCLTKVT